MLIEVYEGLYINPDHIVAIKTYQPDDGTVRATIETMVTNASKQSPILVSFDNLDEFNTFMKSLDDK